jgi:hypothetical protein
MLVPFLISNPEYTPAGWSHGLALGYCTMCAHAASCSHQPGYSSLKQNGRRIDKVPPMPALMHEDRPTVRLVDVNGILTEELSFASGLY